MPLSLVSGDLNDEGPGKPGARKLHDLKPIEALSIEGYRLFQLLVPTELSAIYDLAPFQTAFAVILGALGLGGATWCFFYFRRRAPPISLGLGWFAVSTLPVGLPTLLLNPLADRYLHLPAAGICVGLGWFLVDWLPSRASGRSATLAVAALASYFAVANWHQVGTWRSDLTVFSNAVKHAPRSAFAHQGLGLARVTTGDFPGARRAWERAVTLDPALLVAHCNLGRLAEQENRIEDAINHYRRATELRPIVAEQALFDQAMSRLNALTR
jgi:tetratricopeptide (TPR) repeat protein